MTTSSQTQESAALTDAKKSWINEINIEIEHYFRGEQQQEQRASWILAICGALVAVIANIGLVILERGYEISHVIMTLSLSCIIISSFISIIAIIPSYRIKFLKGLFFQTYYHSKKINAEDLIKGHFRHDDLWSIDSYEIRLWHHFQNHYLRSSFKSYCVLWSLIFLFIGLVFFSIVVFEITV